MSSRISAGAGRVVNVGGLVGRPGLEAALKQVQRRCLAEMFHVSMDRAAYKPWQVGAPRSRTVPHKPGCMHAPCPHHRTSLSMRQGAQSP